MKLIYTVVIDEEICELDDLRESLDNLINYVTGCNVTKSRLESPDEVCETGEWEEEE